MRDKNGKFAIGHRGYRHPKGSHVSPDTEFHDGHVPHNFTGIGVPRIVTNKGKQEVVVTTDQPITLEARGRKYKGKKRTSFARYIWELNKGPIPDGMIVYSNAGEGEIPGIDDLELLSRAELMKRNTRS